MSASLKRKHQHQVSYDSPDYQNHWQPGHEESSRPDPVLFVEAYEADLNHDQHETALLLEVPESSSVSKGGKGSGLICWQADGVEESTWVDRYDARLLLTSLPEFSQEPSSPTRLSPSGWSDLPSDTEDTFFFSPSETDDFRRDKRRRLLDRDREERLRTMREGEGSLSEDPSSEWGCSDEEPDDLQIQLMQRTARHIMASPNPGQLEMRILANHGADRRFAFLRGRWKRAWAREKRRILDGKKERGVLDQEKTTTVLAGLTNYGDSDNEENSRDEERVDETKQDVENDVKADETVKEARRQRAREWAARRRAQKI